jgi:putative MATE family efflux protein
VRDLDREIARLALPALGALIAEPIFLLTDTALVGHLGAAQLAGLGLASAVLGAAVGLLVFLAYAITPSVARRLGAGDRPGAIRAGIDGMWLALGLGVVLAVVGYAASPHLIDLFHADVAVSREATTYLRLSALGLPPMLLVLAATGLLRGLQDTRTPLVVATVGFAVNAGLNAVLIYPGHLAIAGSAIGTVLTQWAMAVVYVVMAVRAARSTGVSLRPGVGQLVGSSAWLFVRTLSLRVALLATTIVATGQGTRELATVQIAMTLFFTLSLALDALAIAGQSLTGHALGSGDTSRVRAVTVRLEQLGVGFGVLLGVVVAALSPVLGAVFTSDPGIRSALVPVLLVLALGAPIGGFVFVLDGVLIGAGDARYLALTGVLNLAVYLPLLLLAPNAAWLWAAFSIGYLGARAVTLGLRARTDRWIRTGALRS